ncbi:MAG: DNA alkylation repair protein, partial [Colwelliaceae bacterium]|nr:DNA alkylation repair protein [Colwelliaceae bacterium]
NLEDAIKLLKSEYHEVRLCAIFFLVSLFERAKSSHQTQSLIVDTYLLHTQYINNWDLVDSSAHKILGKFLLDKDRAILHKLSLSDDLWERRMSMMATYTFIKEQQFEDTFVIAKTLLNDSHDLIHKIVGWMLREVGNQNKEAEQKFLNEYYKNMPRTMLRYAIEKFSKEERQQYLTGKI